MLTTIETLLNDSRTGWGVGVFGAIAEFVRDSGEAERVLPGHARVTARGGIAIQTAHPTARLFAWTEPSSIAALWRQGAALCLPEAEAAIGGAEVVTEIGPDDDALREQDRGSILFDMGVGFAHLRACVRTSDPWVIEQLRAGLGKSLFAPGNTAGGAIVIASPNRVFLSRLARVEVYQPIPPPDGKSPEGPHTHLLPKLLAARRAHPATRPLPEGWISCLDIFPAHPLRDALGRAIPFDPAAHDAFADLLSRFGIAALEAVRADAIRAIRAGETPERFTAHVDRFGRATLKVALRQMACSEPHLPALSVWRDAFDRAAETEPGRDPVHPD